MVAVKLSSQVPVKVVIMIDIVIQVSGGNSIRLGVTVSSQVYQYQVLNMSVPGKLITESQ